MGFFKSQMWKVLEWKDDTKDTIVYRFPMNGQEIMSGSQLTVRESQVAIFVHMGQIADVFMPGKYKLTTKNLPILSGIGSIWYQGESRFKAELYFVNTKQFVDLKWGTTNPVAMRDKEFGVIRIKAHGIYGFRVNEPTTFLKEVFGTNGLYKVDDLSGNLKSLLVSQMSDTIAESKISALDMACNYEEFGGMVMNNARVKFNALGLDITNFTIMNISFPEVVEKALDERTTLGIFADKMGTYTQKKAADALGDAAKNPGMAGAFVGMNLGGMAGGTVGTAFSNIANAKDAEETPKQGKRKHCSECGAELSPTAKFCAECGARQEVVCLCPECNAQVKPTSKFCPECGTKLK
ncbi:MAG: SPFH domain-containing protein [Corallococcus sp.]|nr:SPFH domain-containing protein [Corallococcus sp.]